MTIHLKRDAFADTKLETLLRESSRIFAELLESPIERVRVFINEIPGSRMAAGGEVQSAVAASGAPFFEFYVLEGRPQAQIERVHATVTELIAETLAVKRESIRGVCLAIRPEHWSIAGRSAAVIRAEEIARRASNT